MREYEIFFVVSESKKSELPNIRERLEKAIVAEGGTVQAGEFVDERRMEYPIRGERRGIYVARRFTVEETGQDIPGTLSRKLLMDADILRFIVVRAEDLPRLEESQERVRHLPETRKKFPSRYQSNRVRPTQSEPIVSQNIPKKPGLSDMEIDKKLGEVLDI